MKKYFLLLCSLGALPMLANDFPNSSFEKDVLPVWNRMPDQEVSALVPPKYSYSSDCASGSRSLRLPGQKFQIAFETTNSFSPRVGTFALKMKAPKGAAKVKVKATFYALTDKTGSVEKTFNVTDQWQTFELNTGMPWGKSGRTGQIGPVSITIDPGKSEVLVDDCVLESVKKSPKYTPGSIGGVAEKLIKIPAYLPLPVPGYFAGKKCAAGVWEFRVFPAASGAAKNVPLSSVMLFPKSKVFFNAGNFALYDGKKKLSAAFTPVAAWPGDKSLSALRVDFTCDTAKGSKTLHLRFTPGKKVAEKTVAQKAEGIFTRNGVTVDLKKSHLWKTNGHLGEAVLVGTDYAGKKYTFQCLSSVFEIANKENVTLLRRGKMISADGLSLGMTEVRLILKGQNPGAELDVVLANTSGKMILLKDLYWESKAPKNKENLKVMIFGNSRKKHFNLYTLKKKKLSNKRIKTDNYSALPEITLQGKAGLTLHVFNGTQYHPSELEMSPGVIRGALWPKSAKVLSIAPGLSLRKKFVVLPRTVKGSFDRPAAAMPSGQAFAESGLMINVSAAAPEKFPFFEGRLKTGLGKLAPKETHSRFMYGQFDYGDHAGDGGWANLESFEDYVLFHRAVRSEDPALFRLARIASDHYITVDTDIRSALPHVHCVNHVTGGTPFGHAWVPGVLSSWLLTGDPANYQIARRMLQACIDLPLKYSGFQQGRNFGFYLLTLAEGYAIFNDKAAVDRYMKQFDYQVKRFDNNVAAPAERWMQRTSIPRQNSIFFVNGSGLVPFHCWYGLTAFLKMYDLTAEPRILPVLKKEFKNIMNLEMTYRPQLETHWPGLPAEKIFPAIATDYLLGRGAFYYPVLARYAKLTGEKKYLDLAVDTLYAGLLAARDTGNLQDVFMAAPLSDLPKDFNEQKQIEKIRQLLWNGAAPKLLNGDFSQSLLYRDLVIPKNGIGTPIYPQWALAKPYPKNWHFIETKQIISSQSMTLRGYFFTLDEKEFGKAAPALRLDLANKSFRSGTSLTSAKFRLEPGEYEYSLSLKKLPGSEMRRVGMRVIPFGKTATRIGVSIDKNNKMIVDTSSDPFPKIYNTSYKDMEKPGWKRLSFRFRIPEQSLGVCRLTYNLLPKVQNANIYLDDVEIKRIGD